ncbi:hypothetical protein [Pseudomonas sp. HY7a-MNA-CIBAN-0227]|uniref:hypothetical protein n=1 Tax=Pseudomonas sp. HY7a-MNA-CIBAN-0227 TaxID=3140474 RepID=UPI0033334C82
MSKTIQFTNFNFPVYIFGGALLFSILSVSDQPLKIVLFSILLWSVFFIFIYCYSRSTLWFEGDFLHFKKGRKEVKFHRDCVTINTKNQTRLKIELTIVEKNLLQIIHFPFYFPEEKKAKLLKEVEILCKENGLSYKASQY